MVAFHKSIHSGDAPCNEVVLGVDGIKESNSNKVSLNVYAIIFDGCNNVYPIIVQRPTQSGVGKPESQRGLRDLIEQLKYVYGLYLH